MRDVLQLFHTVRYLRGEQVWFQLWNRLKRRLVKPQKFFERHRPPPLADAQSYDSPFLRPEIGLNRSQSLLQGDFCFVNQWESSSWPPEWDDQDRPKLWAYNLHYFDWIFTLEFADATIAITDWIEHCRPSRHTSGWEPYPTSLRIINWLGYFALSPSHRESLTPQWRDALWNSLALQTDWLSRNLERHLLGNHLFENGVALCLMGSVYTGDRADRWYALGRKVIDRELKAQFGADGMHVELAPMYHVRMVYLLQLLCQFGRDELRESCQPVSRRARKALAVMTHPDGEIALFNDSVLGVYHRSDELIDPMTTSGRLECGPLELPEAGYFGYRSPEGDYVMVKAGMIGLNYQPGHAHGDLFSFEMSVRGRRIFTDTGIGAYVPGDARALTRSTAAHNTVEIEGEDQADFWDCFRVGRRPKIVTRTWEPREKGFLLDVVHDGYERLPCRARCRRRLSLCMETREFRICDELTARSFPVAYCIYLHLHPDCRVVITGLREARVDTVSGETLKVCYEGEGELGVSESPYFDRFGVARPRAVLTFTGTMDEDPRMVEMCLSF